MGLLNPGGPIAQFERNDCLISPVEVISRGGVRIKKNGFAVKAHGLQGRKASQTVLTGYTVILDKLLTQGVTNAQVCLERLQAAGYPGGLTTVKDYIAAHRFLVPAKHQLVAPQGSRGRRFTTEPGEAFQMDWGFTNVNREVLNQECYTVSGTQYHNDDFRDEKIRLPMRKGKIVIRVSSHEALTPANVKITLPSNVHAVSCKYYVRKDTSPQNKEVNVLNDYYDDFRRAYKELDEKRKSESGVEECKE